MTSYSLLLYTLLIKSVVVVVLYCCWLMVVILSNNVRTFLGPSRGEEPDPSQGVRIDSSLQGAISDL